MQKARFTLPALSALLVATCFVSPLVLAQQLTISRSVTHAGTTWLRLFGNAYGCYVDLESRATVATNDIAVQTTNQATTCFDPPPPAFIDTTVDVGHLPDGHYTVTWSTLGPLIPATQAEFDVNAAVDGVSPQIVSEFSLDTGAHPHGITTGPDGNVWVLEARHVVARITPLGNLTEFDALAGDQLGDITAGPDGNLWYALPSAEQIGRMTTLGEATLFSDGISAHSLPTGITSGPDGNVWFTELVGNRIGRITPDGIVTEFSAGISPDPIQAELLPAPTGTCGSPRSAASGSGGLRRSA